jgi:hypothetical protein
VRTEGNNERRKRSGTGKMEDEGKEGEGGGPRDKGERRGSEGAPATSLVVKGVNSLATTVTLKGLPDSVTRL